MKANKRSLILLIPVLLGLPLSEAVGHADQMPAIPVTGANPNPALQNYAQNDPLMKRALLFNDLNLQQLINSQIRKPGGINNLRDINFRVALRARVDFLTNQELQSSEGGRCLTCEITTLQNEVTQLRQVVQTTQRQNLSPPAPAPVTPAIPVAAAAPAPVAPLTPAIPTVASQTDSSMLMTVLSALSQMVQRQQSPPMMASGLGFMQPSQASMFGGQSMFSGQSMYGGMQSPMFGSGGFGSMMGFGSQTFSPISGGGSMFGSMPMLAMQSSPFGYGSSGGYGSGGYGMSSYNMMSSAPTTLRLGSGASTAPTLLPYVH